MYLEKLDVPHSLTFDDVLLEPQASWLEPAEADTRSKFSKKIGIDVIKSIVKKNNIMLKDFESLFSEEPHKQGLS